MAASTPVAVSTCDILSAFEAQAEPLEVIAEAAPLPIEQPKEAEPQVAEAETVAEAAVTTDEPPTASEEPAPEPEIWSPLTASIFHADLC